MDKDQIAAMRVAEKGSRHQLAIMVISTVASFAVSKFTEKAYFTGLQKWRDRKASSSGPE